MLSGTDALRPGLAYIMGLNPGGDPKAEGYERSIIDSVDERRQFSCYLNECWQPRCNGPEGACEHISSGLVKPEYLVKHQRNVAKLANALSLDLRDIFSANAIFARSTSKATLAKQTGHSMEEWWRVCWPVHQHFLGIVRPKVIITLGYGFGSSAFGLLWNVAGKPDYRRLGDNGRRGGWVFDADFPLPDSKLKTLVVGIPHPSYMAVGAELTEALHALAS